MSVFSDRPHSMRPSSSRGSHGGNCTSRAPNVTSDPPRSRLGAPWALWVESEAVCRASRGEQVGVAGVELGHADSVRDGRFEHGSELRSRMPQVRILPRALNPLSAV